MNELSLHILDICENSVKADASLIEIYITENPETNLFKIQINDNGRGMNQETMSKVESPFFTTRTTRKIGMGVSLFKMAAEMTEGSFNIQSVENKGTKVTATFKHNHIDRAPLGNIEETITTLILMGKEIDIYYSHRFKDSEYVFDTKEVKQVLDGIPLTNIDVIMWIKNNITDGILQIHKEESL